MELNIDGEIIRERTEYASHTCIAHLFWVGVYLQYVVIA